MVASQLGRRGPLHEVTFRRGLELDDRRSRASRSTCSNSEIATPMPTAAAIGSSSVHRNVVTSATWLVAPVRMIAPRSVTRSDLIAANTSTAASVGIAT